MDLLLEMLKNADATEGNDEENTTLKELEGTRFSVHVSASVYTYSA